MIGNVVAIPYVVSARVVKPNREAFHICEHIPKNVISMAEITAMRFFTNEGRTTKHAFVSILISIMVSLRGHYKIIRSFLKT